MTPKEKALELFEKFKPIAHVNLLSFREEGHVRNCKLGALIAVDEILKANELNYLFPQKQINCMEVTSDDIWIYETYMEYWQQVKEELNKL